MTSEVRFQVEENMSETSSNSTETNMSADEQKRNMLPWKIMCAIMVIAVTIGWIGMIALLIIKEEWQLVLVAWLMLYAAVHFCYWYCRRNSSRNVTAQLRRRLVSRMRGTDDDINCPEGDCPPSYDDLVKNEVPPPAYYSVVDESPKLKRAQRIQSLGLPWFLKKKGMEAVAKTQTSDEVTVVVAPADSAASTSTASSTGESSGAWKSSATGTRSAVSNNTVERQVSLPSYETLIQEHHQQQQQPVMTPIHQALSRLPTPPPPYSPRRMETISEQQSNDE